jgi:hypothetical protein
MTPITHGLALFVFAIATATACESSKGPPPRVAEVPIDDGTPRRPSSAPTALEGPSAPQMPELGLDPASAFGLGGAGGGGAGAGTGGGAAGGGGPVQLPAMLPGTAPGGMRDVPTAGAGAAAGGATAGGGSGSKPLPPKAERLTAPDCNKLMDKYIELVGISQGIAPDAIAGVMSMLRNSVVNDPNYANALGSCVKENTRTQYRCAMRANDVDGWKKCLQ